jgi:hypothetical protein
MYVNLAISLVIDLGLDKDEIPNFDFSSVKREGLVENGDFTPAARRAYLGTYYVSSASVPTCPLFIYSDRMSGSKIG